MIWDRLLLITLAIGFLALHSTAFEEFECVNENGNPRICGSVRCEPGTVCINKCVGVSCNETCVDRVKIDDICSGDDPLVCPPGYDCRAAKVHCAQGSYLPTGVCVLHCGGSISCVPHTICVMTFNPESGLKEHACKPGSENAKPNRFCTEAEAATCPAGTACVPTAHSVACAPF